MPNYVLAGVEGSDAVGGHISPTPSPHSLTLLIVLMLNL